MEEKLLRRLHRITIPNNPDKAMRKAEHEYLKSEGREKKTLFRKIAEFFRGEKGKVI